MPGVRITLAPAAAANLTPSLSSISNASDASSAASTMASLSPGCRPAWRNRSVSVVFATSFTESHEAIAPCTEWATGKPAPPTAISRKTAWGMTILPQRSRSNFKIAERGQIHERTGVGDDQGLPDLASSFEFSDGLGVRFPVFRSVDDVGDAALLQQVHERKPLQTEFLGGLAGGDLAISEQRQDGFLAQVFLELDLVGGVGGDVDFDLQLHGILIVPL